MVRWMWSALWHLGNVVCQHCGEYVCVWPRRSLPVTPRAWRNVLLRSWTPPQPWWHPVWSAAWMCLSKGVSRPVLAKARPAPFLRWVDSMSLLHCLCRLSKCFRTENVTFAFVSLRSVSDNTSLWCCSPVFQLQRAADAAGLLGVPADQQHREAGPHAAHPAHLPAAGGVATSSTIRQRRPLCHL